MSRKKVLAAAAILLCLLGAGMAALLYHGRDAEVPARDVDIDPARPLRESPLVPAVRFVDITRSSGIRFEHVNGAFGKKLLPETHGSGVAFLDYDKDGKPDLLFANSSYWPGCATTGAAAPTLALYRNVGDGKFADVTEAAGLKVEMYGMGVTVGDFDNDGWPDVFVAGVGGSRLFRNVARADGQRGFEDVTGRAGDLKETFDWPATIRTQDALLAYGREISFPTSAAFLDYDCDGLLDLFVCNYVAWSPKHDLEQGFTLTGIGRTYGAPKYFRGTHCALYRNMGDGTFKNVTVPAGIAVVGSLGEPIGKALGVAVADVDDDGWPDIIVGNDTVRNFFFRNRGNGTFEERGQESGVAYAEGTARGAMGVDWGEYRPGKRAAIVGNFSNEPNTLLRLDDPRRLLFSDAALIEGLAGPSRIVLRFGLFFFDYDLDGRLDLLTCNGHLEPAIGEIQEGQSYKQPVQLYWNSGGERAFVLAGPKSTGPDLFAPIVGRGCAYADIDGDGDLDVVLTENGGPARLFRNDNALGNRWIRFVLEGNGRDTNKSAIGAVLRLTAEGKTYERTVASARGYLSQSELVATFGVGKAASVERVEIRWPNRARDVQIIERPELMKVHRIRQP